MRWYEHTDLAMCRLMCDMLCPWALYCPTDGTGNGDNVQCDLLYVPSAKSAAAEKLPSKRPVNRVLGSAEVNEASVEFIACLACKLA